MNLIRNGIYISTIIGTQSWNDMKDFAENFVYGYFSLSSCISLLFAFCSFFLLPLHTVSLYICLFLWAASEDLWNLYNFCRTSYFYILCLILHVLYKHWIFFLYYSFCSCIYLHVYDPGINIHILLDLCTCIMLSWVIF